MNKNISKSKLLLALISLVITFFVWQQGLKDSLNRPSVSFDISQKEKEITELAVPSIPKNFENLFINNDPINDINNSLSNIPFNDLSERNKLIYLITSDFQKKEFNSEYFLGFSNEFYNSISLEMKKYYLDKSYKPDTYLFQNLKEDRFLFHILNKKFNADNYKDLPNKVSQNMFFKITAIRLIPLVTILLGVILAFKALFVTISSKEIKWKEFKPLDLNLLDMVLLISGGFVVLGEVFSPLFSITLVDLLFNKLPLELIQSLKIFFGYFFMAVPPLIILYLQIKSVDGKFNFRKDYFQFNLFPIRETLAKGFKGWLTIIPFVLLVSLIMNLIVDSQNGSNPLLEIVLNNSNYVSFTLLFFTTTVLAPLFEEIIFRGVLLPILSRDLGIVIGITISAFIFALAHLSISEIPPLFILGIGLGIVRLTSGRLFSSVIMHSLWNGLTFLNLFLLRT